MIKKTLTALLLTSILLAGFVQADDSFLIEACYGVCYGKATQCREGCLAKQKGVFFCLLECNNDERYCRIGCDVEYTPY